MAGAAFRSSHFAKIAYRHSQDLNHGHRPFRAQIPAHFLRGGRARSCFSARPRSARCRPTSSRRSTSRSSPSIWQIYRAQHAGNGAAGHDLQPVFAISSNVNGIKDMEAQTAQRHLGPEDLLPAGRQSRSRDRADRLRDQRHPRADAAGHPAAGRGAIQRLERAGAAAQPDLRTRSTSSSSTITASIVCASNWRRSTASRCPTPAGGKYRQIMVDHRSRQAAGARTDPARRGQRGQRSEPDAARRAWPRSATRNTPCAPTRCRPPSPTSTTSR